MSQIDEETDVDNKPFTDYLHPNLAAKLRLIGGKIVIRSIVKGGGYAVKHGGDYYPLSGLTAKGLSPVWNLEIVSIFEQIAAKLDAAIAKTGA